MINPLIAAPEDDTTAITGIGIAESAVDLANGISDGSWVEAGLGAVGVGLEVLSMVLDPVGTVASYGVSWLIEHVQPLKDALDWFAGDPPVIRAFSQTWGNIAKEVGKVAKEVAAQDAPGWRGQASDGYRGHAAQTADAIAGAATLVDGVGTGVMVMGEVVAAVRELIRDLVAEVVGKLITWAVEAVSTLGLATPLIVAQATSTIAKVCTRIADLVRKLVKTIGNVTPRIRKVLDQLGEITEKLAKLGRRADGPGGTSPSGAPSTPDEPTAKGPDGTTSPSGTTTSPSGSTTSPSGSTTSPSAATSPSGSTSPSGTSPSGTSPSSTDPGGSPNGSTTPSGSPRTGSAKPGTSTSPDKPSSSRPADPDSSRTPEDQRRCVNDPIDVATGEMVIAKTDLALPGVLQVVLRRVHVSGYRAGRLFGPRWASTLDQRVEVDPFGVVYVAEDGMRLVYAEPADGPVLPVVGPRWQLRRTRSGYTVTEPDTGVTRHFDGTGADVPLTALSHRSGQRVDIQRAADRIDVRHSGGYHVTVRVTDGLAHALGVAGATTVAAYEYDDTRNLVAVRNSSGAPLRYDYDDAGRITGWQDRNGNWYRYLYDEQGRCVRNVGSSGFLDGTFDFLPGRTVFTDSLGHSTTFHLNDRKQIVAEVDPLGNVVRTEWDAFDRPLRRIDALGGVHAYRYDQDGNLTEVTRPDGRRSTAEFDDCGQPIRIVEPGGGEWTWSYDDAGRLLAATDPAGATTRYTYDERGGLAEVTDAEGGTRRVRCDAAGLPVEVTTATGATTRYDRDRFGRITAVRDPVGGTTRAAWTVEGKLARRTLPDGTVERFAYDGEGNLVEHVDALGQSSRMEYGHFDMITSETGPDGARTSFAYDTNLRLAALTNANGETWRYGYDPAGRLVRETDFAGRESQYAHDAAGRVTSRTSGAGQTVRIVRDAMGHVVERSGPDSTAVFRRDAAGRVVEARDDNTHLVVERDPLGRVLRETTDGESVVSTYDRVGRRLTRRTPSGAESRWVYDQAGLPVELHTAGRSLRFRYDAAGREVERALADSAVLTQTWDANHLLRAQAVTGPGATGLVQRRSYNYRGDGFTSRIIDQLSGVREYSLDPVGRVTAVDGPQWSERYAYDPAGNITAGHWPADESDAPLVGAREFTGGRVRRAGAATFEHDAQGRVVARHSRTPSGKVRRWRYTWSSEDRLIEAVTPDGVRWRYRYDPLGRRVAKERLAPDGSVADSVRFTWDGPVLAEQRHSSGPSTVWEWQPGTFRAVSQLDQDEVDTRFYAIVTDVVGTPTELVDTDGAIAWHARPGIWGAGSAHTGPVTCPLRFPGQYHDPETGLHYNHHRYYDPSTARYTSSDPLGLTPSPNPYAYVFNPMGWTDPLGLEKCIDNRSFPSRQEALDAAYDRAGIPRGAEPDDRWVVGGDPLRRGEPGYRYSDDPGAHGNYSQFETPNGSRVIAEHTNDPRAPHPHFHAGQPKGDPARDGVDFGWGGDKDFERYGQVDGKHHFFYPEGT